MHEKIKEKYKDIITDIVVVYECDFERDLKNPNSEVARFYKSQPSHPEKIEPLCVRDAVKGGGYLKLIFLCPMYNYVLFDLRYG